MKKLMLAVILTMASTALFAQGRFYIGGTWGTGAPRAFRADRPPPPPVIAFGYSRPASPGRDYAWVDGYYDHSGNNYNWRPGNWERRPHNNARWHAPRYNRGNYSPGYWRR